MTVTTPRPTPAAAAPPLLRRLQEALPERGQARGEEFDRLAAAHDASHFLLVPSAVVAPRTAEEVARLLRATAVAGTPLTFRSGGTSLSGQAVTDGVLADVRRHFRGIEVLDGGERVRVQPGATVRQLNARLAAYGRKFGPDPASEAACTIGGVVANNSSGMACGTVENSYRTLESVVAVLASGTVIDTGAPDADELLRNREPDLYAGLIRLRDRVRDNPSSTAKIAQQFAMKNTMGYGLNSFTDHTSPVDILTHLIVGSEGTLAFVASATFRTIPLRRKASSGLLIFDDLYAANRVLPELVATGASTLELMDATSLRVGQSFPDCPAPIAALDVNRQAALLVEYQATDDEGLAELVAGAEPVLRGLPVRQPVTLSGDPSARGKLWKLRKGLYTSVAGARPSGTTALLEDVVVPVATLADTCAELARLFDEYAYRDSVIFGHAKDGNIHFMLTDRFESSDQLARYSDFTEDLVELILANDGSLKAEHGTGRVMAPYVRRQFGDELYAVMCEVKALFDPAGLLNPGVVITDDDQAHLRHIKLAPTVEPEVDRCVECGYCEPVCPSRDLTLTPRQRIAVRREIRAAELAGDHERAERLEQAYGYAGIETCAVDGMCQTACPVLINTGDLVRRLRRENLPKVAGAAWTTAAGHWSAATRAGSLGLSLADHVPGPLVGPVSKINSAARRVVGAEQLPLWSPELPGGGRSRRRDRPALAGARGADETAPDAVYLPACVNAMFGPAEGPGVQIGFEQLCERAGIVLDVPAEIDSLCCGTPWSSKGVADGYARMRQRVLPILRRATRDGALPLVCDASSCTEGLIKMLSSADGPAIRVIDIVTFVAERIVPSLGDHRRIASITLHPTCSSTQLGIDDDLRTVAGAVAERVDVPASWGCCAFAGDRGMLHPELTAAATAAEAAEVTALGGAAHASCNRTCELGMTRATGQTYRHVVELLAEVTAPDPGHA
ncbi:FAD-binding and (Fe-S)-binding domain-containing protein [Microlunatus ginsengisoli]|uniref:D-lactate dehydrogenase (cytochrome) n=1 Tax=Microlunatus ginsengisoli TaxID=363863 RepID=A0ABP7AU29_9ACTN